MRIELDHAYTMEEILRITGGNGPTRGRAAYLTTDSREVKSGDLFVALRGENGDGHAYLQDAIESGASLVLCEETNGIQSDRLALVPDTYDALKRLAIAARQRINPTVVAVTGSVGKTTTKNILAATLATHFHTHKTQGNFNNLLGVCLTLLSMPKDTEILVCELGMNHRGEIDELSRIVSPDIAAVTNVGTAHIGNLGSRASIARAKLEILSGCIPGALYLYPNDEPLLSPPPDKDVNRITVGIHKNAHCYAEKVSASRGFVTANYTCHATRYAALRVPGNGEHLARAVAIAVAVAHTLGLTEGEIRRGLLTLQADEMRGQLIKLGDITVIEDCYNASPESVKAALDSLIRVADETGGRKLALLGDMLELGTETRILHEEVGIACADAGVALLFTFGAAAENIANGAIRRGMPAARIVRNPNPSAHEVSALQIYERMQPGDVLLIKASRALAAEQIVTQLKKHLIKRKDGKKCTSTPII